MLVGIAFSSIFLAMTQGLFMMQFTQENLRATQIMMDKMEGVRLYSWAQVTNSTFLNPVFTNWYYETNHVGQYNAQGNGIMYTGLISVTAVPFSAPYSNTMVQVQANVGWTSAARGSMHRTRSMTTYVSEMGLQNYVYNSN